MDYVIARLALSRIRSMPPKPQAELLAEPFERALASFDTEHHETVEFVVSWLTEDDDLDENELVPTLTFRLERPWAAP